MSALRILIAAATLAGALTTPPAHAQHRGHEGYNSRYWSFDNRYHHDHYYPARGYVVGAVPTGSISIGFGGGHYFFHGGVWFRSSGPRFVVITPPFGIVVPLLPPAYATVWIGGAPYYYANGVYYTPAPAGPGYVVTAPPPGAETAPASTAPALPEPVVYPRNNQPATQMQADRQECGRWGTAQPGANDPSVYQRAFSACMDGRGYTVK